MRQGRPSEVYCTGPARFREDAVTSRLTAFQHNSVVADPDVDSYEDANYPEMSFQDSEIQGQARFEMELAVPPLSSYATMSGYSFSASEIQGQARYEAGSAAPPPSESHSLLVDGAMPDFLDHGLVDDWVSPQIPNGQGTYEAESPPPPPKPSFDIKSLLSQWTTLSLYEIALGDDQSAQPGPR
jgi:hypothetical protein